MALQGVAWVTMLVDNSRNGSLVEAVGKTFDGQHPCSLCKAVASGQTEEREQKEALVDPFAKLVAVLVTETPVAVLPSSDLFYFTLSARPQSVDDSLPSPPPRAA